MSHVDLLLAIWLLLAIRILFFFAGTKTRRQ